MTASLSNIRLQRAYDDPTPDDGHRVLVDRVWPRGRTKGQLRLDAWARDLGPSTQLRTWFGHDPARWAEFQARYRAELADPDRAQALDALAERARRGPVTLVFGARDTEHNQARVIADELERRLGVVGGSRLPGRSRQMTDRNRSAPQSDDGGGTIMTERTVPDWDPRDPSVLRDQRQAYDEMRARCPVAHSDFLGWSLFAHRDVLEAVRDTATFSSATKRRAIPNGMDPPEHTAYRQLLDPYFTPERMAAFEPRSRAIASALLGPILARGEAEFTSEFAEPFPHQALCAFVGWPVADWNRVHGWTHGNQEVAFRQDREAGAVLAREFAAYVTEILDARRAGVGPADDLIGELLATVVGGEPLSNEDIVSVLRTWTAGHGTVASAVGIAILHLASDLDLQERLRREPVLIDRAVREILRADGPLVSNNRTATREVEVAGETIRSGQRISLMWIAANRDPEVSPDPDRVRLDREAEDNLVFGAGIHRCLGEPLAMLNLRVALEELLSRTSQIELTSIGAQPREVYPSNGLRSLSITLTTPADSRRPRRTMTGGAASSER